MNLSINTLVIERLTMEQDSYTPGMSRTIKMLCELKATLNFYCPYEQTVFKKRTFTSTGRAFSDEEAARRAIENFMNGIVIHTDEFIHAEFKCDIHAGIDQLDVKLPEPLYSMFHELFDRDAWRVAHDGYGIPDAPNEMPPTRKQLK